ncbi:MAG: C40 family peptidase [Armatimonadetes bacterium]|nr:C40 family peptidase [Armatimonadota bacterium]
MRKVFNSVSILVVMGLTSAAFAKKSVLGKLGQTVEKATIVAAPTTRARVYYHAKAFEYLIVNESKTAAWLKVKLKNGRDGYIASKSVAKLPYDVTASQPVSTASANQPQFDGVDRTSLPGYALKFVGTPYVWGGDDMNKGIDCSGFVKKLYGKIGIDLPRTASEQALVGKPITNVADLREGDRLYFWENKRNKIGHTGMYIGNGYFIHSSRGRNGVDTSYLTDKWRKILVAARR